MSDVNSVKQVLARYVRAADARNGKVMSSLFVQNGRVDIYEGQQAPKQIGAIEGADAIGQAVAGMMPAHALRGWSHHTTMDHIVEIEGDAATMDAQFIVYYTVGDKRPEAGWPPEMFGAQGTVKPLEAGYYKSKLSRVSGQWMLVEHSIYLDLPVAFGGQ